MSRVGSAAQSKLYKAVSGSLKLSLAQYRELAAFAQFGSDLDAATRATLNRGVRLVELLKQPQFVPMATEVQIPIIYAGVNGLIDSIPADRIVEWENSFREKLQTEDALLAEIAAGKPSDELFNKMKTLVTEHVKGFLA